MSALRLLGLLACLTAQASCAALAQAPPLCVNQHTEMKTGETPTVVLNQDFCVGPRR